MENTKEQEAVRLRFICTYRGMADYELTFNGERRRIGVRYMAEDDGHYNGCFDSEILPMVGCAMWKFHNSEFPPPEIMALFPGYVPARWNNRLERLQEPVVVKCKTGGTFAREWVEAMVKVWPPDAIRYEL